MTDRPTSDLIVIVIAVTLAAVVVVSVVGVFVVEVARPNADTANAIRKISDVLDVMVGAVVGYLAGWRIGRRNNGD